MSTYTRASTLSLPHALFAVVLLLLAVVLGTHPSAHSTKVAHAIVDSGRGVCADTLSNIIELERIREEIIEAEDNAAVQTLIREFHALETHDGMHFAQAEAAGTLERERDVILGKIEAANEDDESGIYAEELAELAAAAEGAESLDTLSRIDERVNDIRSELLIERASRGVPIAGGGGTTGGGTGGTPYTGPVAVPPLSDAVRTIPVSSAGELRSALESAEPGDHIVLQAGTYQGSFEVSRSGTAAAPVVIRGDAGDSTVSGVLYLRGSHLMVAGLRFANGRVESFGQNAVVGNSFNNRATSGNNNATAVFVGSGGDGTQISFNDITIDADWNHFKGLCDTNGDNSVNQRWPSGQHETTAINMLRTGGALPSNVAIVRNYIHDIGDVYSATGLSGYGCGIAAYIRLGDGSPQDILQDNVNLIIQENLLARLSYRNQAINLRGHDGSVVTGNTFDDVTAPVVIRFQGQVRALGNTFIGSAGIVTYGGKPGQDRNHQLIGNRCEGGGALNILAGEAPPDTTTVQQPASYGVLAANNECTVTVGRRYGNHSIPAQNSTVQNNQNVRLEFETNTTQRSGAYPSDVSAGTLTPADVGPGAL